MWWKVRWISIILWYIFAVRRLDTAKLVRFQFYIVGNTTPVCLQNLATEVEGHLKNNMYVIALCYQSYLAPYFLALNRDLCQNQLPKPEKGMVWQGESGCHALDSYDTDVMWGRSLTFNLQLIGPSAGDWGRWQRAFQKVGSCMTCTSMDGSHPPQTSTVAAPIWNGIALYTMKVRRSS